METLFDKSAKKVNSTSLSFKRYLHDDLEWNARLIGIKGARGSGKTTILLQRIKEALSKKDIALYVTMDDIYFTTNSLLDLADLFVKNGGTHLFLDEVHKYKNWSQELKNIYDDYPELNVVFTSSSALEIHKGEYDLSRRAHIYNLHELSLREYINLTLKTDFPALSLNEIIENHKEWSAKLVKTIKPIAQFNAYLKYGAYPFIVEGEARYYERLESVINLIIENDLPAIFNITYSTAVKLKKLLYIISEIVPFTPNITDLSRKTDTTRDLLLKYLFLLEQANLILPLRRHSKGISRLAKPDKIYLNNTTLMHALGSAINTGSMRETFFMSQMSCKHQLTSSKYGDFLVDNKHTFEIGGKNKGFDRIKDIPDSYIASDTIEFGFNNKIPLWMFGFLY